MVALEQPIYKLGKGVYQYYRRKVKGNYKTPFHIVQKKLTRNIIMADKIPTLEEFTHDIHYYIYGNLHMTVEDNTITWIKNYYHDSEFQKDEYLYNELNDILGITDYERRQQKRKVS